MQRLVRDKFSWAALAAVTLCWLGPAVRGEDNWPQWRGPQGDGHTTAPIPLKWDDSRIAWRAELPGAGQSSPVVWGDRVFLTTAEDNGARRVVLCLSRTDGKELWRQTAWQGKPEDSHQMNLWASATCATDGERVVAFFGIGGLHCYSMDGKPLWSRSLGKFANPWGTAASPIVVGDVVVQNCDAEDAAYLAAFDKSTGEDLWRTPREKLRGWSTPLLVDAPAGKLLVLNGETGVRGYSIATGEELWYRKGDTGRGTPTVTPAGELLIVVNGRPGDMFAVNPDGKEVWRTERRGGRDLPSPIVIDNRLVVVSLRPGMATSYDAASGKELERLRLEGNFSASPIAAAGHALIPNEDGVVYVLKPTEKGLAVAGINKIQTRAPGEIFRASVTPVADGSLLIRSTKTLYCVR